MKIMGLLIDVDKNPGCVDYLEVEDDLEEYYRILNCTTIDIVDRMIGEKLFTIVCDDEGLLKEKNPSAAAGDPYSGGGREVMLVGNLFICKSVYNCEEQAMTLDSLSEEDANYILERIFVGAAFGPDDEQHVFPVVCHMDYT